MNFIKKTQKKISYFIFLIFLCMLITSPFTNALADDISFPISLKMGYPQGAYGTIGVIVGKTEYGCPGGYVTSGWLAQAGGGPRIWKGALGYAAASGSPGRFAPSALGWSVKGAVLGASDDTGALRKGKIAFGIELEAVLLAALEVGLYTYPDTGESFASLGMGMNFNFLKENN